MKNIEQNSKNKPTLFLIIGVLVFAFGIPFGVYGLTLSGGASLGGALILSGVALFVPFFIIDRILIKYIKPLELSLLELIFSLIILLCYSVQ
ncbi:hypothetical protein [Aquimarina sp. Aq107]|uniref:hypothetical protein n=1 Tax=Aquimarina sp. Aq107 TaxID=1191912 RepID=UPI000D5531BA|nr:hypothetical protein [Aquimarina sp. Aq107]